MIGWLIKVSHEGCSDSIIVLIRSHSCRLQQAAYLCADVAASKHNTPECGRLLQALQSQSRQHTESLSQLTQQHQDVCTRLAAAAADAADLQQRADLLQRDNQQLKQQVQQVSCGLGVQGHLSYSSDVPALCRAVDDDLPSTGCPQLACHCSS